MGIIKSFLILTGALLAGINAWGDDQLPTLPAGGQEGLPTVGSGSMSVTAMPDQTISVTCYLGNPNDRQSLGTLMVSSPEAAGPTCNSFNYNCRGRCYGCYSDFDLSEDICVDNSGRKYLR